MDKKTFLVIDSGHFIEQSNALAQGGKNKVFYFTDSERAFPILEDAAPGRDFEHLDILGIPGKPNLFEFLVDNYKEIDCVVNWDSCNQDIMYFLKEMPGIGEHFKDKSVFGAGLGYHLEQDREGFKKILKKLGLDVVSKNTEAKIRINFFIRNPALFYLLRQLF